MCIPGSWLFGGIFAGASCLYFSVGALKAYIFWVPRVCVFDGKRGFCAYIGDGKIVSMFQRCVLSLSVSICGCES